MTIRYESEDRNIHASRVVNCDRKAARLIAKQALLSQLEAQIELLVDECSGPNGYFEPTKANIENQLNAVKHYTGDYLNDMLHDFMATVLAELSTIEVNVRVRAIEFTADGKLDDISVDYEAK